MPSPQFGTAYYPDHWPESDWLTDLKRIADSGLTTVRFGEFSWSWYEPEPGTYDFAALDRFVDAVEKAGLCICLCTPTATPPAWMDELFPDGRLMDMHGRRCLAPRHFWCWNHPGARAKAEETIAALARRYRRRRCLWGWQVDNEPNYAEQVRLDVPETMFDWNPHSQRAFAAWLAERHGTIDALNRAWWTNFWSQRVRTWREAAAPRGFVNRGAWLDFMRWREAALAEQIRWQASLLRRLTPEARIGCNIPETGVSLSVNIGQDYWAQTAAGLDWVGVDLYQATGERRKDLSRHAYSLDLLRSAAEAAGAEFIVSELQAGPHVRAWPNTFAGEGFGADYLEQCAEVSARHGAQKVWWFLWRPTLGGSEVGMNGLQAVDGSNTERTATVRKLARQAKPLAARRAHWLKRPRAVVHYSRASLLHRSAFTGCLMPLEDTLTGWHELLECLGYRIDFLSDAQLVSGHAANARLVLAPFTVVADDAVVNALATLAAPLWCGPHVADCDEHGRLRASGTPKVLTDRLGASAGLWRDTGNMPRLSSSGPVRGWRELQPTGAAATARLDNGAPAAIRCARDVWWAIDMGELFACADVTAKPALLKLCREALTRAH